MKTLLIITAGQTDVQLVINNQRHKLDGNTCGCLHNKIEESSWSVIDTPKTRSQDAIKEESLPDSDLKFCTPKLDALLKHLDGALPTYVLILETTRKDSHDPHMAGKIMECRLHGRGVSQVTRVAFLTGSERLEDPLTDIDSIVRRAVVDTLSNATGQQIKELTKNDHIFVATTGGLSAANEVINELVRLSAVGGPSVTALEVPDSNSAEQDDRAVQEKFHPAAGFRARWHALTLIDKGNFLGAWGAVSHLENQPSQQEWTQVVKWLYQFASSLPFDPPLPTSNNLAVLNHQRMAVRAALRVELALRSGDIPRAVHGTVAFFEAALWDCLNERIEHSSDLNKRRFFKIKNGNEPIGDKLLRKGECADDDRKRPFELKDTIENINWYWIYDGDGGPAARLAKYYLHSDPLTKLNSAIGSHIRELRNDIAHDEPTSDLMFDARTRMRKANLWSHEDKFLSQPLVQNVLQEVGVKNPNRLLEDLLEHIRKELCKLGN